MNALTWIAASAVAFAVYTYAGYPLLLWLLAARRPRRRLGEPRGPWPRVSITVPAYNEDITIGATLESLLDLDYPADRRQILVVSDGSTDRTEKIVRSFAARGIELLRLPRRVGKTAAENAAMERLAGDIIVNTDASVRIDRRALKVLAAAFADPSVGVASARDVSVGTADERINPGERAYVGYEMWLRDLETRAGGIVGASGCCYAIRAELHRRPLPDDLSRDFVAALVAREAGYRAVSVPEALCYVPRVGSLRREYARKVRTMVRGLRTLIAKRQLLNPFRYGLFGWMLWSHKLCRWLAPWALVAGTGALAALAVAEPWARGTLGAGGLGAALGLAGWWWPEGRRRPRLLAALAYALAGQVAVLGAWIQVARGRRLAMWEPTRRELGGAGVTTRPA